MPAEEDLAEFVRCVGAFHITDRAMKRAQRAIESALREDRLDAAARNGYLNAVRRYFEAFEREARQHLRDVDRRLEHVNQVHFNLAAERSVAVKRIEATQSILSKLPSFTKELQ